MNIRDNAFGVFAACVVVAALTLGGVNLYQAYRAGHAPRAIPYSELLDDLDRGQLVKVQLKGSEARALLRDHRFVFTYTPDDPDLLRTLHQKHVLTEVLAAPSGGGGPWTALLAALVPSVLISGAMLWSLGRGGAGSGSALGKSRARLLSRTEGRATFADVAGVDEARESLQEIVEFLKDPHRFERLGGRIPRGVLLVGPPGSGKTLLARAVAGEAEAPFFHISGSDFVEMYVGVGASRVRAMFAEAKKNAPCILFMDEIDAVGRKRGAGLGQGNDEREQTLNQLLVEMDGFEPNQGVILIAATNRPDVLDPALLRPGRFDREVVVSNPDVRGREQILRVHTRSIPLAAAVDLPALARSTPGFSGAELMSLVNEAALLAIRRERDDVGRQEFEDARDVVTMGIERRTHVMTEAERRLTAYREGGKAVVALHAPAADPVDKATIITRGRSTGRVRQTPQTDQSALTRRQMTSKLAILLAGRAAEQLVFGDEEVTSGTAADLEAATRLARDMVASWGLSPALGPVVYADDAEEVFLGEALTRTRNLADCTAKLIATEVRALVVSALDQAMRILIEHRRQLDAVAHGLLSRETLSGEEIRELMEGTGDGVRTALMKEA